MQAVKHPRNTARLKLKVNPNWAKPRCYAGARFTDSGWMREMAWPAASSAHCTS